MMRSRFKRRIAAGSCAVVIACGLQVVSSTAAQAGTTIRPVHTWAGFVGAMTTAPNGMTTTVKLTGAIPQQTGKTITIPYNHGLGGAMVTLDPAGQSLTLRQSEIAVYQGATLRLIDSLGGGELRITGAAEEPAIGGDYSVFGTDSYPNTGTIEIDSGRYFLREGDESSAIGGSYYIGGGTIVINGGTVHAVGGGMAPALGNGTWPFETTQRTKISIKGGTVVAQGGIGGAGIGYASGTDSSVANGEVQIGGCPVVTASGGAAGSDDGTWTLAAGAGIGGGGAMQYGSDPSIQRVTVPEVIIHGTPAHGATHSGGPGGSDGGTLAGGVGSVVRYSGSSTRPVTVRSTHGATSAGGTFSFQCS